MRSRRGFTLVEIVVSIAIFVLLVGGIFTAVQAAFTTSNVIVETQLQAERFNAFQQFLRRLFVSLPANASVELRIRQSTGRGDVIELLLWPMPEHLRFGSIEGDGLALSAVPDGRGRFTFSIGYFRTIDPPEVRDAALANTNWLPLLPDVARARWRFADARNPILSETWTESSGRPGLAELELEMADGTHATFDFWIPPLERRGFSGAPIASPGGPPGGNDGDDSDDVQDDVEGGEP
jgi:prepilin-type N-terminal cleavage/methylation domain